MRETKSEDTLSMGERMKGKFHVVASMGIWLALGQGVSAQTVMHVVGYSHSPAAPGYETFLTNQLQAVLKDLSPKTDDLGNLMFTVGSGEPHRFIATSIDHPGYVVSGITPDGYLRVQRLPQTPPNPVFDTLHFAQPVWVLTRGKQWVGGVFAGLSVHLQPGRQNAPKMDQLEDMYVDIGAASSAEVSAAGVDLLDQVASDDPSALFGKDSSEVAGPAVGDRFGTAALSELLWKLKTKKAPGTTTVVFLTQGWAGGRGLNRFLEEFRPTELIYIGRIIPGPAIPVDSGKDQAQRPQGVLLAVGNPDAPLRGFAAEIQALAAMRGVRLTPTAGLPPRIASYDQPNALPDRFAQLGVTTLWPVTPAETVSLKDLGNLEQLLEAYVGISEPLAQPVYGGMPGCEKQVSILEELSETYGASGHESAVRDAIKNLLYRHRAPAPETDAAGNLVLHLGSSKPDAKTPRLVFVAHMDEIGYQVRTVEPDGRLLVDVLGGGYEEYFLGHVVRVHKSGGDGGTADGVLELPKGWDQPNFEWPRGSKMMTEPVHIYVGTHSAEETKSLGINAGDWATIPKQYRPLLGTRANARSFDDRVGCAALIMAAIALGNDLPGRDVTFIWSTEEEVGLKGAAAAAERMAKEGKVPDFVFALDTFVSADSPLESKRFADAAIGKGFVIRAIDNSNITPREYVDRVIQLARDINIPVQYGVTGGGNDGAVFQRYGSVDIPLGWPLRYSHSPGEVIDTRDLGALARIVAVIARSW